MTCTGLSSWNKKGEVESLEVGEAVKYWGGGMVLKHRNTVMYLVLCMSYFPGLQFFSPR